MDNRETTIVAFGKLAELIVKIWPDSSGRRVAEMIRLQGEELERLECHQEYGLQKADAIKQFCEEILERYEDDGQKSFGEKHL